MYSRIECDDDDDGDENDERMNVNSFMWISHIFMSPRSIKFRPLGLAPRDVNAP
jgi:hypothetical protein